MIGIIEFLFQRTASRHQKSQLCPSVLYITINNRISSSPPIPLCHFGGSPNTIAAPEESLSLRNFTCFFKYSVGGAWPSRCSKLQFLLSHPKNKNNFGIRTDGDILLVLDASAESCCMVILLDSQI